MKKILLAIPSLLASLIAASPVLTCPACWPLYAGLLSAMGISFINYTAYIMPVTAVMLIVSLASLAWKAKNRRGYAPLIIGTVGSVELFMGKFYLENNIMFYSGALLLVAASIWNVWPKNNSCSACK